MAKKKANGEDDFGSSLKFDPTFNGPLKHRSCTDVICLLLFFAFCVCWAIVAFFAFKYGDPARLLVPTDSQGFRCGLDEIVKDKPFLLFFDLSRCANPSVILHGCDTPQVCVEKCPKENFWSGIYGVSENIATPLPEEARARLVCTYDVNKADIKTVGEMIKLTNSAKCAPWYLTSQHISGRCVPNPTEIVSSGQDVFIGTVKIPITLDEILKSTEFVAALANAKQIGQMIVDDLAKSWYWIVILLVVAMVACLIFIVLMRWFAGVMVWISLLGVHVMLGYCIYECWHKYDQLRKNPPVITGGSGLNLEDQAKALLSMKETWLAFLVIASVILLIVFLLTIFLRTRIRIAIALIGEASKAVGSVKSTLFFPLIPWVLQCLVIAWTVTLILFLAGSGKEVFKVTGIDNTSTTACVCDSVTYVSGSVCNMEQFNSSCKSQPGCEGSECRFFRFMTEGYVDYLHAVNLFGFFWALFFVSAIGEMILASTFATWYWTYKKSDVPFFTLTEAIGRTFRYNLGTVAFGSLILAICRMIRVMLEFIDNQLKKYDNAFVKCLLCCCKCFFWCLENFIKFINRNAYIMCAVHGKNFCASAKDAFNLLMRNVVRVFVLDKVTDFLLLLGKLLITAGVCALAFFIFDGTIEVPVDGLDVPTLNYSLMPVFVVAFGTYFIATIFFGVYEMAVDTLFLCFLEDSERNDGSIEKPYFMSKSLRKILDKKNKKAK